MSTWQFRIWGQGDDTLLVDGYKGIAEFDAVDSPWGGSFAILNKDEPHKAMRVQALYDGCWSFAVGPIDPMVDLPDWPYHFERGTGHANGYSMVLVIDAPAFTNLYYEPDSWDDDEDEDED